MKIIISLLCLTTLIATTHANEVMLVQKVEVSLSAPEKEKINYSKTMLIDKPVQFDVDVYRFNISSKQIDQKSQAMVETKVSKKDENGEFQEIASPSMVVMFKKQAQFKTEDGDVTIDFRTIIEKQNVANQ